MVITKNLCWCGNTKTFIRKRYGDPFATSRLTQLIYLVSTTSSCFLWQWLLDVARCCQRSEVVLSSWHLVRSHLSPLTVSQPQPNATIHAIAMYSYRIRDLNKLNYANYSSGMYRISACFYNDRQSWCSVGELTPQ